MFIGDRMRPRLFKLPSSSSIFLTIPPHPLPWFAQISCIPFIDFRMIPCVLIIIAKQLSLVFHSIGKILLYLVLNLATSSVGTRFLKKKRLADSPSLHLTNSEEHFDLNVAKKNNNNPVNRLIFAMLMMLKVMMIERKRVRAVIAE